MTSSGWHPPHLPQNVSAFLDGTSLQSKVGETILLVAADADGWPRMALLSVGEVLAVPPTEVALALYAASRTTKALMGTGRGLLLVVADGTTYKIQLEVEPIRSEGPLLLVRGEIVRVDEDRVSYAQTVSGVRYELDDEASVMQRWEQQIETLRTVPR